VDGHFALVNHQLLQIRNALAISQKLGRGGIDDNWNQIGA
jgi:hypothetical protein